MLYEEYRKKVIKFADILKVIKKFRILIICVFAALISVAAVLLSINGIVYDVDKCPSSIEYGQSLGYRADAIMNGVRYEYSTGDGEWSETPPRRAGDYLVRAVSKNAFGGDRYGNEYAFTILPKQITVVIDQSSIRYGDTPTVSAPLEFSDSVTCSNFIYEDYSQQSTYVIPDKDAITVKDSDGNDVTSSYVIDVARAIIDFTQREINITVSDKTGVYDGLPLSFDAYELSEQTPLAADDSLVAVFDDYIIDAGQIENLPEIKVFRTTPEGQVEVTGNYKINIAVGALTVEKRPVYVWTGSATKTYDGTGLSSTEFGLVENSSLVEGHSLELVSSTIATVAGEYDNVIEFKILDADGNDKSANYSIFLKAGKLTVEKRPVSISTVNGEWVYDGLSHSDGGHDVIAEGYTKLGVDEQDYGLLNGHTTRSYELASITDAGTTDNKILVQVLDGSEKDVTANYDITYEYGTLTVTPRPVTVESATAAWVYDGQTHSDGGHTVCDGEYGLAYGHSTESYDLAQITNVGTAENVLSVRVFDGGENEVTKNYTITYVYGELEITLRPITVVSDDKEWIYDGLSHGEGGHIIDGEYGLADGHTTKSYDLAQITDVGTAENILSVKVFDGAENEVTENYSIAYEYGTLEILPRPITIETASNSWVYDGAAHSDGTHQVADGEYGLVEGHNTLSYNLAEIITVGTVENVLEVKVYAEGDEEVTSNYEITYDYGTLTVTPRPITIETASNSWVYDGQAHSDGNHQVADGEYGLVEGHHTLSYNLAEITTVGTAENILEVKVFDGAENEVTENYSIAYVYGTLEILPRPITIETASNSWVYDGQAHSDGNHQVVDGEYGLVDGHYTLSFDLAEITDVDAVDNLMTVEVLDFFYEDVTSNYAITYEYGTLTITPRPVTIESASNSWVYDGAAHSDGTHQVADGEYGLAYGHITESYDLAQITYVGTAENMLYVRVFDGAENEVTENYAITYDYGELEITPRPVKIISSDYEWIYDGQAHSYGGHEVDPDGYISLGIEAKDYGLVEGHTTLSYNLASITDVGTVANTLQIKIFDGETEVTNNYNIIGYEYGTLEILPRPITIETASDSWVYDGAAHSNGTYRVAVGGYGLVEGHYTRSYNHTEIITVGTVDNVMEIKVYAEGDEEVTSNYEITYIYGTLEILPRPIKIETASNSWVYDGAAHSDGTHQVADGEYGLVEGHYTRSYNHTETTTVGTVENLMEIKVYAEGDEEVTSNYEITYVYGELEITPRPVTVESASNSWVYDGEAHSDGAHQVADGVYGLVTGHRTESYNLTQITDVGTAENVLYVKVFDGAENEVTENYEITYVYGELEITPRPVKIVSSDYEWIYDGQSHSYDGHGVDPDGYVELGVAQENYGLVYGHNTVAYDLATIIDVGSRDNVLKVRVLNGYDEDVTSNYEISYAYGTLTVKCRPITVTAGSSTKIYDGMPLRCGDYFVTSEIKLLEGHTLTAETEGSRTDAGESLNVIKEGSVVIKNASGAIVNDYYYVTFESGSLTVSQRPITVVTASNSWVYDGEAHSDGANQVSEGDYGLVEGHYTRSYNLAEIITVGTVENRMDVKVYSEEGEEVTSNYAITYLNGTLAVTSRPIIIETASNSWVYDGQAHSDGTHWVVSGEYGLVGGHRTESYNLTQITDVGTADNVLSVRVFDGGDNEVTENYAITYVYGELEITRRPIIVKTFDYEWVYDGQPHSYDVHEVDPDGYVTLAVDANDYGLVSGHTTLSYNLASITDAGSTPNTMDIIVLYGESVVTDNYEIKGFINGTLTVTPRPITVTADSSTKIYDGTPLTCGTYSVTSELKLVGNHVLTAETEGSQTDAGSSANKITVGSVVIKDASGADMSDNYAVTLNDGTLTVTPRPITITAGSSEKDYDGTPLTYNSFTVTSDLSPALVLNHEAKPEVEGSRTEVGESENVITSVKIFEKVYDGEILTGERDVTANYEIVCKDGLLTVMIPGKLVVKTGDAEKVYDGTVLTCSDYTIIKNTLGQGFGTVYVVVVECTGSITDSGQTQNGCTIKVYSDETELTKYARIAVTHGLLKVIPRPIVISTGSDSWDYDGKTHTCEEYVLSDGYYNEVAYGLVAGHSIAVTDYAKIILPGVKDNTAAVNITAIIDGVEVNVTDNYSITFDLGILEIVSAEQGGDGESAAGDLNTSGIIGGGSLAGGDGEAVSFKVYSEVSGLTYFRLLSYGGYTGVSWSKAVQYGYLVDDTYSANYLAGIALENGGYTRNVMSIEMLTNDYLLPYYTSVNKVGDLSNYDIQTGDVWNKGDASSVYSLYYYLYDYLTDGAESVGSAYSAYEQAYRSFVYEQYLSVPEDTNTYLQSIIAEQGFDAGDSDIIKKVALYIQGSARYNKKYNTALDSESDVVVAFLDSYKEGICQHYASAATLMYRALGIPARYTIGYVGNTSADEWVEIGPNMAHAWTEVFIDGMGWINVEVTGAGAADGSGGSGGSGGSSGSQGQNKELSLKPVDRTKTYDGTPLTANAIEGTDSASSLYLQELLSEGYTFTATFDGSITLPGTEESSIQSLIIKDSNGVQVNDLSVTYETGTLTVVSADAPLIRIYPYALQKCYDGTPLAYGANDYYVSGLPDGWSLDFSLEGISLTEAGVVKSDVLSSDMVTVYNQNGVRQTEEIGYYLSFECTDLLTVDRRCITITSMSDIKEYDGEPLTNSDYWVSVGSLASGHRLQVEVTGTITNIGTTKNTIVGVLITDSDGNDVTACYNIAIVEGVLEVIPD